MWGSPSREIPGRSQSEQGVAGREEQGEVIAPAIQQERTCKQKVKMTKKP